MLHILIIPALLELPSRRGATSPKRDLRGGRRQAPPQLQSHLEPTVIIITLFIQRRVSPAVLQFAQLFPQPHEGGAGGCTQALPAGLAHHRAWAQGQSPSGFPLLAQAAFPVLCTDRTPGGVGTCGESRDTDTVMGGKWGELQGLGAKCKEPWEGSEGPVFWKTLGRLDLIRQMGWTTRRPRAPKCNDPDHTRTCRKPRISPIQTSWAMQSDCVWSSRGNRIV